MHNGWFADHRIDAVYVALPLSGAEAEAAFRHAGPLGLAGLNVTAPFKEVAAAAATRLDAAAATLHAANVLTWREDALWGANTDAPGFIAALDEAAAGWRQKVASAAIIGSGGAGRAIALGLRDAGVSSVTLVNRDAAKGKAAADLLGLAFMPFDQLEPAIAQADLIVNATTLGMGGGGPDWPLAVAKSSAIVVDAVYSPLETKLLATARSRGLASVDGLGMLIHQGALAFSAWFGVQPNTSLARRRLMAAIKERGG
jgi:shikimate dehydrogenase